MTPSTRRANLGRLYGAEVASGAGDGVQWVALITVLADETNYGVWLGLAVLARLGPRALLSIPAGSLVDRTGLRSLLVATDLARAMLMFAVWALAVAGAPPGALLVVVCASHVVGVPTRPGLSAALPRISGETKLADANASLSLLRQLMTFVGPLIGVGIVTWWSAAAGFALNAMTFVLAALLFARLRDIHWPAGRSRRRTDAQPRRPRSALTQPFRRVFGTIGAVAGLPALIGLVGAMYLVRGAEMVLWVLVVRDLLEAEPSSYGYLAGAVGLGAVLATPLARRGADSVRSVRAMLLGVGLTAVPTAVLAVSSTLPVACALLVVVGAGMVVFEVISVVTIQRAVDSDALGRVFGAVNSASNAGKLLGAISAPLLVTAFGTDGALLAVAATVAVIAVLAARSVAGLSALSAIRREHLRPYVDVLGSLALFDGAPRAALELVADAIVEEELNPGTVVIREGEIADDVYIVRTGDFDVTVAGAGINTMGPGAWFGEIGLVEHVPRTATVVATSPALVWRIPGGVFLGVPEESGAPPSALVAAIAERLATGRAT